MTKGHHKTASFTVQPDSIEEQNETKLDSIAISVFVVILVEFDKSETSRLV